MSTATHETPIISQQEDMLPFEQDFAEPASLVDGASYTQDALPGMEYMQPAQEETPDQETPDRLLVRVATRVGDLAAAVTGHADT